jgi:hypothetical protein
MASKRARGREVATAAPVLEEVEDTKSLTVDSGIIIATFLLLCTALTMVWYFLDARYPGT